MFHSADFQLLITFTLILQSGKVFPCMDDVHSCRGVSQGIPFYPLPSDLPIKPIEADCTMDFMSI